MHPTVSVIMPCFNAAEYIRSAVSSIVNQTYANWELIIVDDASHDRSVEIIESIKDSRIVLIKQPVNKGYPSAMNLGIEVAKGEFIARMDADDICLPSRFEDQLKVLSENPTAAFCGTNRFRITPGGKMYIDKIKSGSSLVWESWEDLMNGKRIFTDASVIIKRKTILEAGGYRTYQRSGMDVDLWLRVMEKFGAEITLMKPLYGRTIDPNSLVFNPKTRTINQIPRIMARQRVEKGFDDLQTGRGINLVEYISTGWIKEEDIENKSALHLGSLVTCLWLNDWKGARIYYQQIRRTSDLSLLKITFEVAKKLFQRLKANPYIRYHPTV